MATMEGFEHILNWKLKQGSHPFPGKDGGTCINEAAVVAAGFTYRPIRAAEEMPDCFSRPICRLAMRLNDDASDQDRQRLLPYVTRLACADTPEVERKRAVFITSCAGHGVTFERGLEILEGALAIGRQASALEPGEVVSRMAAVQRDATTPTSVPDTPLFAKVKNWFGLTKETEAAET
jgi:hypothetical protein